ncbi:MAG: F0F1 ATP synthase subunit B [Saprospiraceae bacterium]|jgi:F-type H+-transporting ATPase subunit b|nr:F0F1 ATP synthase subunit B [Lewinellaceae bacterium]
MLFLGDFSVIRPEPGLLFWTTVIFLLFWYLMSRFAFKPIAESLKKREMDIQEALDQAKLAREEMANLQAENEKLLAQAREERAAILKDAKDSKDEIIAEAKERANAEYKRKVESAIQDIENQKLAAMVELKNTAGKLAIEIAEKVIRKELADKTEQEAYAKSLVDQIKLN